MEESSFRRCFAAAVGANVVLCPPFVCLQDWAIDVLVLAFVCFDSSFCYASDCALENDVCSRQRVHSDSGDWRNFDLLAISIGIFWKYLLVIWNALPDDDRCYEVIVIVLHLTAFDCMVDSAMESSAGNFFDYARADPQVIGSASTMAMDDDHLPDGVVSRTNSFATETFAPVIFALSTEEAISIFSIVAVETLN